MNRQSLLFLILLAGSQFPAAVSLAASSSASSTAASKEAASRYAADKKLCAEESSSSARMQCLRDAKAEYTKALAEAKTRQTTESKPKGGASGCADCGKVLEVTVGEKAGEGGALGIIGGGVAGAILGHQVGGGTGKDLATIAGAAGGAYAGHKIEEKMKSTKVWSVKVRLDTGEERTFAFDHDPGFSAGESVKLSGNSITRR
ncbi:MAG: glycine zipper 2TM domain-containing protein [Sterolibacterium sp.]